MLSKKLMPGLLFLAALAGLPSVSAAAPLEITVCSSGCYYSTIQGAINVAYTDDTILVSDGTYAENINFKGKNIIVKSVNGAASTKIVGSGANNPVVTFSTSEPASTLLQGFTIDNKAGANSLTRGVFISNSAKPTIKNCVIQGNNVLTNYVQGAGIYISGSSSGATIQNVTVGGDASNKNVGAKGSGIYVASGTSGVVTISDSTISYNSATQNGGGIMVESNAATMVLTNTSIANNTAMYNSGGIYSASPVSITGGNISNNTVSNSGSLGGGVFLTGAASSAIINGVSIVGNKSLGHGAGLYMNGSTATEPLSIVNSTITDNWATTSGLGGGVYVMGTSSTVTIVNSDISNNKAIMGGGGIYSAAPTSISGTRITGNSTSNTGAPGGGLYLAPNYPIVITDTVISDNVAKRGGGIYSNGGAQLTISVSRIDSNRAESFEGGGMYLAGTGSVSVSRSYVRGNTATMYGGGIYTASSSASFTNCWITGNVVSQMSYSSGGGLLSSGGLNVVNSTIAGNYARSLGGGIRLISGIATVTNSILWGNVVGGSGSDISGLPTVTYSDIQSGYSGEGNIKLDPLFVNLQQALPGNPTTAGDFHILNGSPVIDTGTTSGAPSDDIDGDARPQIQGIDMGADEFKLPVNNAPVGGYTSDNVIPASQITVATDVIIRWKGRDAQSDKVTLKSFQYSIDGGVTWSTPSNGDSTAALSPGWSNNGASGWSTAPTFSEATVHTFTFNTKHADVNGFLGVDRNDVKVRFKLNDGKVDSSYVTTESFRVNNTEGGGGTTPPTPPDTSHPTVIRNIEVVASSSSQITVLAGFNGDSNLNGYVTVEYSKDSTWDSSDDKTACGKLTGGSPRTCFVSGLKADTTYYIRVTYTDPDGVTGENGQLFTAHTLSDVSDIFPPTLAIIKPMDGGVAAGNSTYPISIDFTAYDRHSGLRSSTGDVQVVIDGAAYNAARIPGTEDFFTYLWTTPTLGNHTVYARARDNAGNLGYSPVATFNVNSITTEDGIFAGDGKLLVRDNDNQICWDCHGGIKPHSSQYLSPKYGNWSLTCRQCHQPHNTTNIFLVKEQIKTPNSGYRNVDFRSAAGRADYSFANTVTPGTGPCETCHTKTSNGNGTPRYRNTGTGPGDGSHQNEPFTGKCIQCHDHKRGFSPVSAGGLTCGVCHPKQWTPMNGDTSTYHMYVQNSNANALSDGLGPDQKYPSKNQPSEETDHRRCLMCHADMEVFSRNVNPDSAISIAYNLRASVTIAPVPGDLSTHSNTDFRGDLSEGGVCLSCHRMEQVKNNAKKKNDGTTKTPPWDVQKFGESAHNFTVENNFKADNSSFKANCVKCHNDDLGKDYQKSDYKFGLHDTKYRSMLSNINKNLTFTESSLNSTEENFCYQCHSQNTDGPQNYNPFADKESVKDAYNVEPMREKAVKIKSMFEDDRVSFHPINGKSPYNGLNGLGSAAGEHKVDEWLTLPSGVRSANWNPANNRHVECTDCHNPHAASKEPRSLLTWWENPLDPTGGSFGGQIGGANKGVWGVEPVYTHLPWNEATSYTKVENVTHMYQLCFKCHSSYAYGGSNSYGVPAVAPSPPKIPRGSYARADSTTWSWSEGPETDMAVEFNPNNYGFHPILRRGRNQPAPHLNSNWPYFNGGEGNGAGWQGVSGDYVLTGPNGAGTVNYDVATRKVTIAGGRNFPTYYLIPGWKIQFNTDRPSSSETWYEIKTVDSPTQITLVNGPSINLSGTNYVTSAGLGWAFVPPFGPWSVITCADCHSTTDSNGPVGPHGSDNPWLLRSPDVNARVDNNLNGTTSDSVDAINSGVWVNKKMFCFSCHRRDVYGTQSAYGVIYQVPPGEPSFDSAVERHPSYSRLYVHPPFWAEITDKNVWGIWCMNCHGGDSMGGMHGSNREAGSGAPAWSNSTTPMGVRLRNGAASIGHRMTSSGGTCYFGGTDISSCSASFNASYTSNYDYTGVD
ncbi:MAG: hypothetical protein OEV28_02215 [Nitrospirota bacterium]|nr:hypothetical protein [Nitrospirota bacterium]